MLQRKKREAQRVADSIVDENLAGFKIGVGIREKLEKTSKQIGTTLNEKQFIFGVLGRNIILLFILGSAFIYFSIDIIKVLYLIFENGK